MSPPPSSSKTGLVAVVAAKGGCGATFVATHLAAAAAAEGAHKVLLADFDASRGDVARALDLEDRNSFQPLVDYLGAWDAELLRHAVPEHKSGLRALLQPYDLSSILRLEREEFEPLLTGLRGVWPLVIADCGTALEVHTLTTATTADRVVLVTHGTVPAVRNAQRLLALLDRLQVPLDRVALVVNAHTARDLDAAEIERLLEHTLAAVLPFEPACREVDTTGGLLSELAPRSPVVRALNRLAADLGVRAPTLTAEPAGSRRTFPWGRG